MGGDVASDAGSVSSDRTNCGLGGSGLRSGVTCGLEFGQCRDKMSDILENLFTNGYGGEREQVTDRSSGTTDRSTRGMGSGRDRIMEDGRRIRETEMNGESEKRGVLSSTSRSPALFLAKRDEVKRREMEKNRNEETRKNEMMAWWHRRMW